MTAAICLGLSLRRNHHQAVAGKDGVLTADGVGLLGIVHLGLVGAGKDIRSGALAELGSELARGAEVERQPGVRVGLLEGGGHVLKTSVSDEAAKTTISPETGPAAGFATAAAAAGAALGAAAGELAGLSVRLLPTEKPLQTERLAEVKLPASERCRRGAAEAVVGGAAGAVVAGAPGAAQAATRSRPTSGASSCLTVAGMQALSSQVRGAPMYHLQRRHDEHVSAATHTDVRCT